MEEFDFISHTDIPALLAISNEEWADQIKAAGINVTTEFKPDDSQHDLRLNQSGCQGFCQM